MRFVDFESKASRAGENRQSADEQSLETPNKRRRISDYTVPPADPVNFSSTKPARLYFELRVAEDTEHRSRILRDALFEDGKETILHYVAGLSHVTPKTLTMCAIIDFMRLNGPCWMEMAERP